MDEQNQNNKSNRKTQILFAIGSFLALIGFVALAYYTTSKTKAAPDGLASQEQFEGSVEISTDLQAQCQQSAQKISELKDVNELVAEFKAHVEACKDVYFVIDHESKFRKEGMFPDLIVDIALFAKTSNPEAAFQLLDFGKNLPNWDFYLGPVSCDSKSVLEAYSESMQSSQAKQCLRLTEAKEKLLPELQKGNFDILYQMLPANEIVWMGQPESDSGCPEKVSTIITTIKKLIGGGYTVDYPQEVSSETNDLNLVLKSGGSEKAILVFSTHSECLQIKSVLVPSLEVAE